MDKRKIILDCDPGHDDAVAIMLAAKSPQIDLLGITVVAGNQTLEKTTANALNVCQYLGLDIPVYAGCGQPMIRDKQVIADDIHGETGLDGPVFAPLRKKAEDKHAVLYIIDTLMASDGDITLVPTGPLTNIAMAIRMEPRILPKIREIVLMGGCYQLGNVTPAAEFNILADADAAHVVFTCNRPITMVGLDVTLKAALNREDEQEIRSFGNKGAVLAADILDYMIRRYADGGEDALMHDALAAAAAVCPQCLVCHDYFVDVECQGEYTAGHTMVDRRGRTGKKPNVSVAMELDLPVFKQWLKDCLRQCG